MRKMDWKQDSRVEAQVAGRPERMGDCGWALIGRAHVTRLFRLIVRYVPALAVRRPHF